MKASGCRKVVNAKEAAKGECPEFLLWEFSFLAEKGTICLYKEKMHQSPSNAEIELMKTLSKANLTEGMVSQEFVMLKWTLPDFLWRGKMKALYLDGEAVHEGKVSDRDEEIDNLLERQGWDVKRIRYRGVPSEKTLAEWIEEVRKWLG